jgi:hypothetical protein
MNMHHSTFQYLSPTLEQVKTMAIVRDGFALLASLLLDHLPDGDDKTHAMRTLRTAGMWANVSITRNDDGSPRDRQ